MVQHCHLEYATTMSNHRTDFIACTRIVVAICNLGFWFGHSSTCVYYTEPSKQTVGEGEEWGDWLVSNGDIQPHMRWTKVKSRHSLWIKYTPFEKWLVERQAIVSVRSWSRPQLFTVWHCSWMHEIQHCIEEQWTHFSIMSHTIHTHSWPPGVNWSQGSIEKNSRQVMEWESLLE